MNSLDLRPHTASTEITSKKNSPQNAIISKPYSPHLQDEDFQKFIQKKLQSYRQAQEANQIKEVEPKPQQKSPKKHGQKFSFPQIKQSELEAQKKKNESAMQQTFNQQSVSNKDSQIQNTPPENLVNTPFEMLWNSNYLTKYNINDFISLQEENKALKAKIWNYEKENRKMVKQIEAWGLKDQINNEAKPFVDSTTLAKVFHDTQYQSVTKKQEMLSLQSILDQKSVELKGIEKEIAKQKEDGGLFNEFEKDQIKEFYVLIHKINKGEYTEADKDQEMKDKITKLEEQKGELKKQNQDLLDMNNLFIFEIDVQQNMYRKLIRETDQTQRKVNNLEDYIQKQENVLKDKQPSYQDLPQTQKQRKNRKNQDQQRIEKTDEEILNDKINLIDEHQKKIEQLNFQIQEMIRTCIMEKQDLLKEKTETEIQLKEQQEKYLEISLGIQKFEKFEDQLSSDKSNCLGDSLQTEYSDNNIQSSLIVE